MACLNTCKGAQAPLDLLSTARTEEDPAGTAAAAEGVAQGAKTQPGLHRAADHANILAVGDTDASSKADSASSKAASNASNVVGRVDWI